MGMGASTALNAIPALYNMGVGIAQGIKANKLDDNLVDPTYDIPKEYQDMLGVAKSTMPQTRQMSGQANLENGLLTNMATTGANINQNSVSSGDSLAALVSMNKNYDANLNQIGMRAASDYENKMNRFSNMYTSALGVMAAQKEKQFQINTMDKFNRDAAAISALRYGSLNNIQNGINGIAGAVSPMI